MTKNEYLERLCEDKILLDCAKAHGIEIERFYYGTNQNGKECWMMDYYYNWEDKGHSSPMKCSVQTFKRNRGYYA